MIDAVVTSISLEKIDLPDEFFPAHISVAVIDAVIRARYPHGSPSVRTAERYCRKFGLARTRVDHWNPPSMDEQEILGDLIRRCDALGPDAMETDVFGIRRGLAEHPIRPVATVLYVARALWSIGVHVLQDMSDRHHQEIAGALQRLPGVDEHTVRRLLMYTGGDDFVLGDAHVRHFVARALGRSTISSVDAETLVRSAAYELILSPRFLDREIWLYSLSHSLLHDRRGTG